MQLDDFVIHFKSTQTGALLAQASSLAGEVSQSLRFSPSDNLAVSASLNSFGEGLRERDLLTVGTTLFESVFSEHLGDLFHQSLEQARSSGRVLRVVIHIGTEDGHLGFLQQLPWEILANRQSHEYFALSQSCSIMRRVDRWPRKTSYALQNLPLRVLLVVNASTVPNAEEFAREDRQILEALRDASDIEVTTRYDLGLSELRAEMMVGGFTILHLIGQGTAIGAKSAIIFPDESGNEHLVTGKELARVLSGIGEFRLFILNAYDSLGSTNSDRVNPFPSLAAALVLAGVPSVLAMQFPISARGSAVFTATLYRNLARGESLASSLSEGRVALRSSANPIVGEWAAPALFAQQNGDGAFMTYHEEANDRGGEQVRSAQSTIQKQEETSIAESDLIGRDIDIKGLEFKGIEAHTDVMLRQLENSYEEARRDSRVWSISSIAAAGLGLGMIVAAILGWASQIAELSAVTGFLGAVSGTISALFFRNWRQASGRLASMVRALEDLRRLDFAQSVAQSMDTAEARDEAKTVIIQGIISSFSANRSSVSRQSD